MRNIFIMMFVLSLTACSSTKQVKADKVDKPEPKQTQTDNLVGPKVAGYKDVEFMNRNEVIQASKDCINARMRPIVQYVPQKTQFGTLMLPAVVNCELYSPNQK
jgi:hypothetical protein